MPTVQLATLWNSTTPAAPSGRQNVKPQTDGLTPVADSSWHMPNVGGVNNNTGTTATLGQAQQGTINKYNNAAGTAVTLSATGMDAEWMCYVANVGGTGNAVITPTSGTFTFGTTSGASALTLNPGGDAVIFWDGTNWVASLAGTAGGSGNATSIQGIPVSATAPVSGDTLVYNGSQWAPSNAPAPNFRRWAYATAVPSGFGTNSSVGETFNTSGTTSYAAAGTTFKVPVGTFSQNTSGARATLESALVGTVGSGWAIVGDNMFWSALIAISVLTNIRFRAGVGNSTGANWTSADTLTTTPYAAFRFSSNAGDTDFMCETGSATAVNVASSGIAAVANTLYILSIQFNDSIPNVVFSINNAVVYTSTTDLPPTNTGLAFDIALQPLTSVTELLYVGWVYEQSVAGN